jgi:hypothetical protein
VAKLQDYLRKERFDVNKVNEKLFEIMGLNAENEKTC